MREVFATSAVPTVHEHDGRKGTARFVVRLYDATEAVPLIHDYAQPVAQWLLHLPDGQHLRSQPPAQLRGTQQPLVEAVVPRSLLEALPSDGLLAAEWQFIPGGAQ